MQAYLEFKKSLKQKKIAPVYLFFGEEEYLRLLLLKEIKNYLLSSENAQFNVDQVDGEETAVKEVLSLAESPPFLSERRLVIVRHAPYFTSRSEIRDEKLLLTYLKNPLPTTCIVFDTGYPVDKRKKLFQAVSKAGRALEFTFLKPEELTKWFKRKVALAGKAIEPKAAQLLISRAGKSMTLLANELDKLISFVGEKSVISIEDVQLLTVPLVEENIFAVVDALGKRQLRRALNGIKELLAANHSVPYIIAMVTRQFRMLLLAKEMSARGYIPDKLSHHLGVPSFVAQKILAQSRNFSLEHLSKIMEQLLELDVAVKSGKKEFYPAMEQLVLSWQAY